MVRLQVYLHLDLHLGVCRRKHFLIPGFLHIVHIVGKGFHISCHHLCGILVTNNLPDHLGMLDGSSGPVVGIGEASIIFWSTIVLPSNLAFLPSALTLSSPFLLWQNCWKCPFLQHLEHSLSKARQLLSLTSPLGDFPCPFLRQYLQFSPLAAPCSRSSATTAALLA